MVYTRTSQLQQSERRQHMCHDKVARKRTKSCTTRHEGDARIESDTLHWHNRWGEWHARDSPTTVEFVVCQSHPHRHTSALFVPWAPGVLVPASAPPLTSGDGALEAAGALEVCNLSAPEAGSDPEAVPVAGADSPGVGAAGSGLVWVWRLSSFWASDSGAASEGSGDGSPALSTEMREPLRSLRSFFFFFVPGLACEPCQEKSSMSIRRARRKGACLWITSNTHVVFSRTHSPDVCLSGTEPSQSCRTHGTPGAKSARFNTHGQSFTCQFSLRRGRFEEGDGLLPN